jgi:hypothetical protein
MVAGYPGTAKTGADAVLVSAGFKVRILDYDGNLEPLWNYSDPAMHGNVSAIHFEDPIKVGPQFTAPSGVPSAFANGLHAMDRWRFYEDTGEFVLPNVKDGGERKIVDLGSSKDWGPDTIVILDTMTKMGDAAFYRAMALLGKTPANMTIQGQMLAQNEQLAFIKKLRSPSNRFHVIVNAHLKTISPKDVAKGDTELTADLKARIANIVPTKLFPRALGQELPQHIGGEFSALVKCENKPLAGGRVKRIIRTQPEAILDIKVPAPIPPELPIENGLLAIFNALSPGSVAAVCDPGRLKALLQEKE